MIEIERVTDHPQYESWTTDNDFSLVKLKSRASASPVAMDQGTVVPNYSGGEKLWAIGFGNTGSYYPDRLQDVEVAFVPEDDCNQSSAYGGAITSNMMCAAETDKDSCQGDSVS